jgi:hypothetical protein
MASLTFRSEAKRFLFLTFTIAFSIATPLLPQVLDAKEAISQTAAKINARIYAVGITITIKHLSYNKRTKKLNFKYTCKQTCDGVLFRQINGQSPWTKLFLVIADVTGAKLNNIKGQQGAECSGRTAEFFHGRIYEQEDRCTGAIVVSRAIDTQHRPSLSVPPTAASTINTNKSAKFSKTPAPKVVGSVPPNKTVASEAAISTPAVTISQIKQAIFEFFRKHHAKILVREQSPNYVVATMRGAKNVVLKGHYFWEKILVFVALNRPHGRSAQYTIHVVTDGYYTAGMGSAPPLSSYTNSMEPRYYEELDTFTRTLANNLATTLTVKK